MFARNLQVLAAEAEDESTAVLYTCISGTAAVPCLAIEVVYHMLSTVAFR